MPNIKSAKKRVLVSAKKTMQNKMFVSELKTTIKKYEKALAEGNKELAAQTYKDAVKFIDRAVSAGHMHKNTAARRKSLFTKKLNALN
ncbi:MAG: 30S ribosomal protein S20 [Clostridia bacterium]|nr:30S ribosomal protein S20 [Clostridia bacterium]